MALVWCAVSSVSSTKDSLAHPSSGARCVRGRGVRRAGLDYLETDAAVDAKHVGIEGVSRYGKAALVTLAFEQRFAMGLIGSSGKGGATRHRRKLGRSGGESHRW